MWCALLTSLPTLVLECLMGAYPTCKIPFPPASHFGWKPRRPLGLGWFGIRGRLTQFVLECPLPAITLELVVTGMGSVPSVGSVNSTHVLDVFRSVVAAGAMSSVHSALTHVRGHTYGRKGGRGVYL